MSCKYYPSTGFINLKDSDGYLCAFSAREVVKLLQTADTRTVITLNNTAVFAVRASIEELLSAIKRGGE
jgi:hypothetical protein